jgi:S1-C subfamily serine protease
MRRLLLICSVSIVLQTIAFGQKTVPLTQRQACAKFSNAVVRIDGGGHSRGSGFIVSPDGYILTALHVVRGEDGQYFSVISVMLPGVGLQFAKPATPLAFDNVGRDYALLKVDTKEKLPFLSLGTTADVVSGGDATIVGFPFSAISAQGTNTSNKFCLSATFAATDLFTVPVDGSSKTTKGIVPVHQDVRVNYVYFQGPSIKGISGSPIISRDTGRVVGIVSLKLTGIGNSLMDLKTQTARGVGSGISISGLNPGEAINQIVTVLDDQLANGLGAATGIDDPKEAVERAQRSAK